MRKPLKTLSIFAALAGVVIVAQLFPWETWLRMLVGSLDDSKILGMAVFILAGILCVMLFVPVTVPVTAAGLLFGFPNGLWPSLTVLALGSTAGFWSGRFFRSRLQRTEWFRQPVFQAVCRAIEEGSYTLLALLRMTPFLHFMTGNLLFGTLDLRFGRYLLFSLLGMVPGTILLVYGGSIARSGFVEQHDGSLWQAVLFGVGLVLFLGIAWRVTHRARRILRLPDGKRSTTSMQ
jgi:uncharacterized membrane protein YdjX (TVP38/TMEM64 family)